MHNFTDRALILFPKLDTYNAKTANAKYRMHLAYQQLDKFLAAHHIEPHAFYTDDVAHEMRSELKWVSALGPADNFFISKKCVGLTDALSREHIAFPDIIDSVVSYDIDYASLTDEMRFELVLKHAKKAISKIIPQYKLIIHFVKRNNAQYKVTKRTGDGRVVMEIDVDNFVPTIYMSGMEVNPTEFLQVPYGNLPVYSWKVG